MGSMPPKSIVPDSTFDKFNAEKLSFTDSSSAAKAESKWKRTEVFKSKKPLQDKSPINTSPNIAFALFAIFNTVAAFYSPIFDCDEVFNYWEPTHYLNHSHGFQTWEYSPVYAIRSWAYVGIHAILTLPARILPTSFHAAEFYALRIILGLLCAACQTYMYTKVSRIIWPRVGQYLMLIFLTSPGMFHASVAFLPSSFVMYTIMLGISDFIDWRGGAHTAEGMFWFGLGSVLGWPFIGVLLAPFLAEEMLLAYYTSTAMDVGQRFIYGTSRTILVGVFVFFVDLAMYRKYVCVAFNIVWYNVVAATTGKGPNIFGTEPWHFYIRNLVINFHIWFLLALMALPALYYQEFVLHKHANRMMYIRNFTVVAPLYLWLAIMTLQPHKEERFMYPIYPAIAINAAITTHLVLKWLGAAKDNKTIAAIPAKLRLGFVGLCLLSGLTWGGLRIAGLVTGFGAPLNIYKPLSQNGLASPGDTVCLGKEWYRFPSHYHLPAGVHAKFIQSEFDGLLPGEFSHAGTGFGLFPGAWLTPPGMNDENKEDPGKYTELEHCTFLVDSSLPGQKPTDREPDFVHDEQTWKQVQCLPYLDTSSTGFLGRLFWLPDWPVIPEQFRRRWGQYCLLQRQKS